MENIGKYLALFANITDYNKFMVSRDFVTPNVSVCDDTKEIFYNGTELKPFVITNTGGNSLTISLTRDTKKQNLTYKVGNGEWETTTSVTITQNNSVSIVSSLEPSSTYGIGTFAINGNSTCKISGSIMSLYGNKNSIEDKYVFSKLFSGCTQLVDASELELPATTLTSDCYSFMFNDCTSLTSAPQLSATTLAENCYQGMFGGCTSLKTAPELLATTLTSSCYYYMFEGCSNLNNITMLATNISATNCLTNWVDGVSSSGTFVKRPLMSSLKTGKSGIPNNWEINYYVEEDKYPYIITTELSKTVTFNVGTSETWEAKNNIVNLINQFNNNYLKLQPTQELNVDIYNLNVIKKNIVWDVNTTLEKLCQNNDINNTTQIAIFINEVKEIEGEYGYEYGYY